MSNKYSKEKKYKYGIKNQINDTNQKKLNRKDLQKSSKIYIYKYIFKKKETNN